MARTRWLDHPPGMGWDYGAPRDYLREPVEYWLTGCNGREHEAMLNQFPPFITTLDGQDVLIRRDIPHVLATTPQGELFGVLVRDEAKRLLAGDTPGQIWRDCECCRGRWTTVS